MPAQKLFGFVCPLNEIWAEIGIADVQLALAREPLTFKLNLLFV